MGLSDSDCNRTVCYSITKGGISSHLHITPTNNKLSMKFQLVLAALVGLVASASFYPPISSADLADQAIGQKPAHARMSPAQMFESGSEFNDILSRHPRYLRVDNVTVVNA